MKHHFFPILKSTSNFSLYIIFNTTFPPLLSSLFYLRYQQESQIYRYSITRSVKVREFYWQIQCYQMCYQPESVIGKYSVTRSVTSQRVLLADIVLPGVLPPIECYWQIQYYQECYPIEKFHLIHYFLHITFNPPLSLTVSSLF